MTAAPAVYLDHLRAVTERDAAAVVRVWEPDGVVEFPYATTTARRLDGRDAIVDYFTGLAVFGPFRFTGLRAWSTGDGEWLAEFYGSSTLLASGAAYEQDYVVRFGVTPHGTLRWMREYWDPTRAG